MRTSPNELLTLSAGAKEPTDFDLGQGRRLAFPRGRPLVVVGSFISSLSMHSPLGCLAASFLLIDP